MTTRACEGCGRAFVPSYQTLRMARRNPDRGRWCSRKCAGKARRKVPPPRACAECGRPCPQASWKARGTRRPVGHRHKFCSKECRCRAMSKLMRGKGQPRRVRLDYLMLWKAVRRGEVEVPAGVSLKDAMKDARVREWLDRRREELERRQAAARG